MNHTISIDVEGWHHAELARRHLFDERDAHIIANVRTILSLLAEHRARATFFVIGELTRSHPGLVEQIAAGGHEIACHGLRHLPLHCLTPDEFRHDLETFQTLIAQLGVPQCRSFRAPTFSLSRRTAWALPILREFGFRYDSSVFGMATPLYGIAGAPLDMYQPADDDPGRPAVSGTLWEVPVSLYNLGGWRIPVGGGIYMRVLPIQMLKIAWNRISRQRPLVIYLHPWEIDTRPVSPNLPRTVAWSLRYNNGQFPARLRHLLTNFTFVPLHELVEQATARLPVSDLQATHPCSNYSLD